MVSSPGTLLAGARTRQSASTATVGTATVAGLGGDMGAILEAIESFCGADIEDCACVFAKAVVLCLSMYGVTVSVFVIARF